MIGYSHSEPLPTPQDLKQRFPLTEKQQRYISQSRRIVGRILDRTDQRLLLVTGPCSIHDTIAAKEYASKLKQIALEVGDSFFIVMRVHCEKPRTIAGWKGFLYDPFMNGSHQMATGLTLTRQLMLELTEMEVPIATEFLDPLAVPYFSDLVTWGSIGARTVSSQIHRQIAAGLPMPVGFKNSIDGNVETAVHALLAAKISHSYMGINDEGQCSLIHSNGNSQTHIVLRGGAKEPNYDPASVNHALHSLEKVHLPRRVMIDCSHDNSQKKYDKQPKVFQSVIHQVVEGNKSIIGLNLESHLKAGHQHLLHDPSQLEYGISITDPCLDLASTHYLLSWAHQKLQEVNLEIALANLLR